MAICGEGGDHASLLIVGSHNSIAEQEEGSVFRGPGGDRLRALLRKLPGSRELIWLDNIVHCMPPAGRAPTAAEATGCRDRIIELIQILDPDLILAMGSLAVKTLTKRSSALDVVRGQFLAVQVPGELGSPYEVPTLATYHPGQFEKTPDEAELGRERMYEDDLQRAIKYVAELQQERA